MKIHKFKVLVMADGKVVVEGVPVTKGQEVEVTIRIGKPRTPAYPLHGLPIRYDNPFDPAVDDSEWNASK